jgi:hypothetical protein
MRIGIDMLAVVPGQQAFGGVGRFLSNLLQLLPIINIRNEYLILAKVMTARCCCLSSIVATTSKKQKRSCPKSNQAAQSSGA